MKKPMFFSSPNGSIFNLMRVPCLLGIILLAAGALFNYTVEAQAKPIRGPVRQAEGVVQYRGVFQPYPGGATNEYTRVDELMFPELLLTFENNSVSGSASVSTSFNYMDKDWTAEGSIELNGTYDPETGVVEGSLDKIYKWRFPPDPGFHDNGVDVHYYGTFKSWFEDPTAKFSLEDAALNLNFSGMVASDRYYENDNHVFHSENEAGFLLIFVREAPDASDCTASVYGLDPLVPADVISPGAAYTDQEGTEVGILQERWFINGQETNSVAWDGNRTTVELQWTCLGHQAHSQTFEIAAYQPPPVTAEPVPGEPAPGGPVPGEPVPGEPASPGSPAGPGLADLVTGLGIGLIGLGGVAGLGGLLGLGIPILKAITAGPAAVAPVTPPAQVPAAPAYPYAQAPATPTNTPAPKPGKLDPSLKKPWELKINDLTGQRSGIQDKIQSTNDQIIRLTRLYKNNILKVIMKGGLETGQILFDGISGGTAEAPNIAIEIGKKALGDKVSNAAYQKHDTSQDGKTVVDLKNLIDTLKGQRDGLRNQVKDINREIKSIQEYIRNEF